VNWMDVVLSLAVAVNIATTILSVWRMRRMAVAEQLLLNIVQKSFRQHHAGTFQAWAEVFGSISVTVDLVERKAPS